jgi:hypothetical protein
MPANALKSYAKQSGRSLAKVEAIWNSAKEAATKAIGKKGPRYWAYANAVTRKRLGLVTESVDAVSFKEYVDLTFEPPVPAQTTGADPTSMTAVPQANPLAVPELPPQPAISNLIAGIFAARDKAHELHLAARSFAQHLALNELYDALLAFADELAEMYQGKHGILTIDIQADDCFKGMTDPNAFIQELVDWLEVDGRVSAGSDSFIINKFEEMLGEIYKSKYKLNCLS